MRTEAKLQTFVGEYLDRLRRLVDTVPLERIEAIGEILFDAYRQGKQVLVVGNGGSAATASHMASDLGRSTTRPHLPGFRVRSLNDNVPLLTALANDAGYEHVYSEQLVNVIGPGDVLVVLSGSGSSPNVLEAMRCARGRSATVVALLGFEGGEAVGLADEYVLVPSEEYGLIEDMHSILNHALTGYFKWRLERGERAPSDADHADHSWLQRR
jgi:D-sedoheptulose 7-phosphate isomerase